MNWRTASLWLLIAFILGLAAPAASAGSVRSYVQATIVAPDVAARTLSFVDPSGRSRSYPLASTAVARVGRLRPGDEVIVILAGSKPVVEDVRIAHPPAAVPAADPASVAAAPVAPVESASAVVSSHELRPTWPNPYSRFYRGPKPPPPRQRR
jgi:hypothetical protein